MYGTKGVTPVFELWKFGFDKGSTKKIPFKTKDIGEIQKIRVSSFFNHNRLFQMEINHIGVKVSKLWLE